MSVKSPTIRSLSNAVAKTVTKIVHIQVFFLTVGSKQKILKTIQK